MPRGGVAPQSHGAPGRPQGGVSSGLGRSRRKCAGALEQGGMGSEESHTGKTSSPSTPASGSGDCTQAAGQGESQVQETHQGWPG